MLGIDEWCDDSGKVRTVRPCIGRIPWEIEIDFVVRAGIVLQSLKDQVDRSLRHLWFKRSRQVGGPSCRERQCYRGWLRPQSDAVDSRQLLLTASRLLRFELCTHGSCRRRRRQFVVSVVQLLASVQDLAPRQCHLATVLVEKREALVQPWIRLRRVGSAAT